MARDLAQVSILAALLLVLGSCASLELEETWTDPSRSAAAYDKILVIGMSSSPDVRQRFERVLASAIEQRGRAAVTSVSLLPANAELTRETVEKALEKTDIDAVIVTRLAGFDVGEQYRSGPSMKVANPYDQEFAEYFEIMYETAFAPGYDVTQRDVLLETNLFDVDTGKMVWTATSKAFDPETADEVIEPLSKMLVDRLARDGML